MQGQIQDIAPSPQCQCLCLHIASHVSLSCKVHGLKFLLSPVRTQLSIWRVHKTLWEEPNPQSPECFPQSTTTSFLCQNVEDNIPAFHFCLHPREVKFYSFLRKEFRRKGRQFIMIQAFKHTQQHVRDSQWCTDLQEFLFSGFESLCNPQNYAKDFRSIQDLITSSLPPKSECRLHRTHNPWNIWCLPQVTQRNSIWVPYSWHFSNRWLTSLISGPVRLLHRKFQYLLVQTLIFLRVLSLNGLLLPKLGDSGCDLSCFYKWWILSVHTVNKSLMMQQVLEKERIHA